MAFKDDVRNIVDPLFLRFREELMGSGISYGRLSERALPITVVYNTTLETTVDGFGYIKGITTQSAGSTIGTNQKTLRFYNASMFSVGDVTTVIIASGFVSPLTTQGDIIYESAGLAPTRLPIGITDQVLTVSGGLPAWKNSAAGFTNPMTTIDDIIVAASGGAPARLAVGTASQILTVDPTTLHVKWSLPATASGTGSSIPTMTQFKFAGTQVTSIVLDTAPAAGHSLILFSDSTTGQITSVASTNTTWTQLATYTSAGGSFYSIWVGIAAASASATITFSKPGTFNSVAVAEITDTLTPTLGASANNSAPATISSLTAVPAGRLVVYGFGADNTTLFSQGSLTLPYVGISTYIVSILLAYATGNNVYTQLGGAAGASILASIS